MTVIFRTLLVFLLLSFVLVKPVHATHLVGGELTYQSDTTATPNLLRYFFKLVTYQDGNSVADEPSATLYLGDGVSVTSERAKKILINNSCGLIYQSTYYFEHTFPGPGIYSALYRSPNRVTNLVNLANSDQQTFTIRVQFAVDLFEPRPAPVHYVRSIMPCAVVNQPFRHSLAAYNREGDSLVHELITPLKSLGSDNDIGTTENVVGYTVPRQVSINAKTGELIWDKPEQVGAYSFAVRVNQFRENRLFGSIMRDFVVNVTPAPENFTQTFSIENRAELSITDENQIFLTAGQPVKIIIKYQTTGQAKKLDAVSELFLLQPTTFDTTTTANTITTELTLNPIEAWRRNQPYILVFRGTSELNGVTAQQDYTLTLTAMPGLVSGGIDPGPGKVETSNNALFVVYPNPAQNHFWVKNKQQVPRTRYLLYNALQQQILKTDLNLLNTRIMLPSVATGIYFYQIISETGQVRQTGKLHVE